ncbi:flagellin [Sphingomonas bacterium]|uniref:flagellin N-terminal helical domain-containing protein n=1 Tax=Sphingomonas bacterium TaxID=1895847 RepID=UPI001576BF29|nr:flagellin [Sphingomonas bacterium]
MIGATRYISAAEIARQTRISSDLAKLQQTVSTGKRLTAASDDPVAAARIASIGTIQADHAVYAKNIGTGSAVASAADAKLASVQTALTRAKELLLNGRTQSASAIDRNALATEINSIGQDIAGYAAATDPQGRPLFPAATPTSIPISDSLSIAATASQASVFGGVVTAGGTKTIATILASAATALQTGDTAGLSTSLDELDAAMAHITTAQTDQGLRAGRFADMKTSLENSDEDLSAERSGLEDTDLTYALSEIQSKQLALQAAQTVFAQSHKSNLFSMLG